MSPRSQRFVFGYIDPYYSDIALLAHSFVTGLIDCSTFNNWSVFVGGQTGNTVLLALSTANLPEDQPHSWLTTFVSIVSFLLGAFATGCVPGSLRRITLTSNLFLQGLFIAAGAALVTASQPHIPVHTIGVHMDDVLSDPRIVTAIPFLAFQAGMQLATSRLLGFMELPVNVLTSTYADLVIDPDLFRRNNPPRRRRILSIVFVILGAVCAAWIMRKGPGIELALWLGAALKIIVAICTGALLPAAEERDSDDEEK